MSAQAWFYLIVTNLIGGASYFGTAWALEGFSSRSVVFLRIFLGVLVFIPYVVIAVKKYRLSLQQWLRVAAMGFFGYAAPQILGILGQERSSATNAALMISFEPIAVIFLAALFLHEPLNPKKIISMVLGIAGVCLIVMNGIPFVNAGLTPHFTGDLLLLLHAVGWALYSILGKPLLKSIDPLSLGALSICFSLIPASVMGIPALMEPFLLPLSPTAIGGVLFLAIGVTFFGTLTWCIALNLVSASRLAFFTFLQPLVGAVLGIFLLGDEFSIWKGTGGLLIVGGIFLATREWPGLTRWGNKLRASFPKSDL